ncbi:hypothetical protein VitviT2T_000741 [Vitis vinifera]|uniref:Uncharacterized protein n=1 Tax=Vitis vinifera TaxID=29760 RepID=A0ABY9BDN5_VITVI|nr:hypothetical protein VitviT2T_000741 [Vitis vinifera]
MMEILKRVSCFTDAESPSTKRSDFFPLIKGISVNLGGDPPTFVSARLPFGTLESVVSRIQQLQDCTVSKTTKVCAQLFEWLDVAEAIRAFISHRLGNNEELCVKLERVEADLAVA